jgi:hypothetical protein
MNSLNLSRKLAMRPRAVGFLALFLLAGFGATAGVVNGGFETGDFTGWTQSGNTSYTSVTTGSTYAHSGTYGAQLGPAGSLGYLSQTLSTTVGTSYLLSVWLDSPDGATPNEFLVSWNGSTLLDETNLTAFGWTNLRFVVSATGTSTILQFGFRDDPTSLGLDDISVVPSALTLTRSGPTNDQFVVSWTSRGALEEATQIAGPWMAVTNATNPFTNSMTANAEFFRLNQTVDTTTLHNKVLCGYQGWFRCPGDGGSSWFHWSSSQTQITTNTLTFEMWPDMTDYSNNYAAPGFTLPGGAQAYLFSPQDAQTVDTHFDWMQDYGIDGVVVQRFVSDIAGRPWMTNVLNHVREAANRTGRTFCLEYDMSGANTTTLFSQMTNDWTMLVNAQHVTQDPRYLFHNGKPVLFIFGFFTNRFANAALPQQIIYWFETNSIQSVTLIGSGEWWWNTETDPGWTNLFRSFDGYEPWNTGNYTTVGANKYATTSYWATDLQAATDAGMIYLPEIYPGFSWDNLQKLAPGTSKIDRLGGDFLWQQFYAVKSLGLDWAFVGMFDEVDEGTAIFKVSNTPPTQGYFVTYDGYPTDWYLRLTAEGSKVLSGEEPNTPTIPISP